jgi:hypothetical protein
LSNDNQEDILDRAHAWQRRIETQDD